MQLSVGLVCCFECGVGGDTKICPMENLNMGKLSCPPAVGWGGVRRSGGRKTGKEGGRGKRYENMTCLRIGNTKTIHSSGFPKLPWFLLHLQFTISSYHVKGSPSLPRLAGCLILREQFAQRAERQWPACLHPGPFLFF